MKRQTEDHDVRNIDENGIYKSCFKEITTFIKPAKENF